MLLKNTKFAFPCLWESLWKSDSVPISSTIGQHIIPKFPFPSFPSEQNSTSSDISSVFSGNLYIDNNKLSIWKLKILSSFSSASLPSSALFFLFNISVCINLFLFLWLQLSYLHASHTSQTIHRSLYIVSLCSVLSLHALPCLLLSKFNFTLCLSHSLFTPPHCAVKSLHTAHEESFLYFYWGIRMIRNQYEDVGFNLFDIPCFSHSTIFLLIAPSEQFFGGAPCSFSHF